MQIKLDKAQLIHYKMMVICKETLLKEIEGSKAAIETMKNSIEINKIVLAAFEAKLKTLK